MMAGGKDVSAETVYLDGGYVPAAEACIHVDDRAFLFADSIFETLRAYRGRPWLLERHLERMAAACSVLRIEMRLGQAEARLAVAALLERNGLTGDDARVRLTLTGGPGPGPKGLERPGRPVVLITARRYSPDPLVYTEGVKVIVSGIKRNTSSPLSMLKSGNYLDSLLARQEAVDRGADDAVMVTTAGNLAEATSSNLFMVRDGEILTPNMGCAFLPGVTREVVMELCAGTGITLKSVMEGPELLLSSDEAFLTNSMTELVPIRQVVETRLGAACPGPVTSRLMKAYHDLVERSLFRRGV